MARRRTLKLSDSDFKVWLLNHFIDENGDKVSFTDVLNSEAFIKETGLSRINKETKEVEPVSRGTLSYWCYNIKYGVARVEPFKGKPLTDDVIYQWGVNEGLIKDIAFEDWANTHNRNGMVNTNREINSERIFLNKVAKVLNSAYRVKDLDGNTEDFRRFLIRHFGVERYKDALRELGVDV